MAKNETTTIKFLKPQGEAFKLEEDGLHEYHVFKTSSDSDLNQRFDEAVANEEIAQKFEVIDLHSHTNLTDGVISPQELIDQAVLNGVTVLAVTDHNCTKSALVAKKYAEERYPGQIRVILGVELSTTNGHLLIYCENEDVVKKVEEAFPFIRYVNERTDEMQRDYMGYYARLMEESMPSGSVRDALDKLEKIKAEVVTDENSFVVKTSSAHSFAGSKVLSNMQKRRGLTSMGGIMADSQWTDDLRGRIDMFEVQNDFSPVGNRKAVESFTESGTVNLSTGSDSRIADPRTLTLVEKGEDIFDAIESGRTIFIQRDRNSVDKYYDRIVQWQAWLLDHYMSEVRREVGDVMEGTKPKNVVSLAEKRRFVRRMAQRLQLKVRKCLYGKAYSRWEEIHNERMERKSA